MVNAHIVYQTGTNKTIQIKKFREILVPEWSDVSSENTVPDNHRRKTKKVSHHLEIRKNQEGKPIRMMCTLCYEKKRQTVACDGTRKTFKKLQHIVRSAQNHPKCICNVFLTNTMRYSIM